MINSSPPPPAGSIPLSDPHSLLGATGRHDQCAPHQRAEWRDQGKVELDRLAACDSRDARGIGTGRKGRGRICDNSLKCSKPRKGVADINLSELGFAREAIKLYPVLAARRVAGRPPSTARFQVRVPTPLVPVFSFSTNNIHGNIYLLRNARR